jgi:hypothetical protein
VISLPRTALSVALSAAFALTAFMAGPAQATGTGILGVNVTARYTAGHTSPMTGASVVAVNLDTGAQIPLSVFGNPASSGYYQAVGLPFGRYHVRIERSGFATMYWPRQFSPDTAGTVVFGTSAGCNPGDAAVCDTHLFTAEVPQLVTVSGTVRHRSGATVPNVVVSAQRDDEPTFRPAAITNLNGGYALQLPDGQYTLQTPNGGSTVEAPVTLSGPVTRDLILLDPPAPPQQVVADTGNRQVTVSWQRPLDDGGAPISSYTVTTWPGSATCSTQTLTCTVPGLQNGQDYRFTVVAENRIGSSAPSAASRLVAPSTALPSPVADVRLTSSDRSLDVTWSASPSDDILEYTAVASPGGRSCSTASLACTISGLRNGTAYSVSVTARSQAGISTPVISPRRATPSAVPSAPRAVRVTAKPSALKVVWNTPLTDGGKRITEYVATAWPGGRSCRTDGNTSCVIRKLDASVDYSVTVRAANTGGVGATSPGSVPTRPLAGPSAPRKVTGLRVRVTKSQAVVRWRQVKGATSYWVRVKPLSGRAGNWVVVRRPVAQFSVEPGSHIAQVRAAGSGGPGAIRKQRFVAR